MATLHIIFETTWSSYGNYTMYTYIDCMVSDIEAEDQPALYAYDGQIISMET